ncbi:MAG: helix-turn-helix transcriptional regulator [Clostridiaceae bacterium]|nr:helix-turn-helix transcriptional regulator [Clostridiaceae bacterium]
MKKVKNMSNEEYGYDSPFPKRFRALTEGKVLSSSYTQKISQKELAEKLNLTRQTIGRYADGTTQPNITALQKIADFFQVSCDWLIGKDIYTKKEYEEISYKYGLSEGALKKLEELALNPFTEEGRYVKGSVPLIELVNTLIEENSNNGLLDSIIEYLYADKIYTIDFNDLEAIDNNDFAYKLKERLKLVDSTVLDISLLFDIQSKLKQLKDNLNSLTNYR